MSENRSWKFHAITIAVLLGGGCAFIVTVGLHVTIARREAATQGLPPGYDGGPRNFVIDPLVSSAVLNKDMESRESSIKLLIVANNPAHVAQLRALSLRGSFETQTNAAFVLDRLNEAKSEH